MSKADENNFTQCTVQILPCKQKKIVNLVGKKPILVPQK